MLNGTDSAVRRPSGFWLRTGTALWSARFACWGSAKPTWSISNWTTTRGFRSERNGLCGAPPIRVLASNRHGSVERAIRLLGIGEANVVDLELDDNARITPAVLSAALMAAPVAATIVVLQAGDINSGSFDDYRAVIPVAKRHGSWVHVDGAFGLWAAGSPRYRHFLDGVAEADSWATDGHKWLNVPYDSGYAFVIRPEAHRADMSAGSRTHTRS